jgi:hypothetical protein
MYDMAMPWLHYGGDHEGFYLASLDRDGLRHFLIVQDLSAGHGHEPLLGIAWNYLTYIAPGGSWTSPCIVMSLHTGDWHAAADRYRRTLRAWYQLPDTPRSFKRSIASYNSAFTARDFSQIGRLAADIRQYGVHDLILWYFGDYYPNVMEADDLDAETARLGLVAPQYGGLSGLAAANQEAAVQGVRTGIIFSQRLWNLATLTPELRQQAEDWVIRRESGVPVVESWNHHHYGGVQWNGHFGVQEYVMCCAHEPWQAFALRNIGAVISRAGYTSLFYDQAVEVEACFNPLHHHADVSAPSRAALPFLTAVKAVIRQANPDAILIGEGFEMLASQVLDLGWCWTQRYKAKGARRQFSTEVMRYALPWSRLALPLDDDIPTANEWFVLGLHLAIVPRSLESGKLLSDFPAFAGHVASLVRLSADLEAFLVDGRFMDTVGLTAQGAFARVYIANGGLAVLIANLEDQPATCRFTLDGVCYGLADRAYRWRSCQGADTSSAARAQANHFVGEIALAPYEVGAAIFQRDPAHEIPLW